MRYRDLGIRNIMGVASGYHHRGVWVVYMGVLEMVLISDCHDDLECYSCVKLWVDRVGVFLALWLLV